MCGGDPSLPLWYCTDSCRWQPPGIAAASSAFESLVLEPARPLFHVVRGWQIRSCLFRPVHSAHGRRLTEPHARQRGSRVQARINQVPRTSFACEQATRRVGFHISLDSQRVNQSVRLNPTFQPLSWSPPFESSRLPFFVLPHIPNGPNTSSNLPAPIVKSSHFIPTAKSQVAVASTASLPRKRSSIFGSSRWQAPFSHDSSARRRHGTTRGRR